MNRDFLSNFERLKKPIEPDSASQEKAKNEAENEFHDGDYIRNVCFVWPEGKQRFFNYIHLDSGEITEDHDTIKLIFGSDTVELVGLRLLPLFTAFLAHKPKYVYCDDARYNELDSDGAIVNEINVEQN
jgi:hypothetical protein